jgi:class 3 adenylate cyclase
LGQGDVRGLTVHAAARIMSIADADDVIASSTVRDLVDGSSLRFEDYGLHELKGLPGPRQLYRLVRTEERAAP